VIRETQSADGTWFLLGVSTDPRRLAELLRTVLTPL
jgi:hypothetical protein